MVSGTKKQQEDKKLMSPTGFNINNQQYDLIELNVFRILHIPPNVPP